MPALQSADRSFANLLSALTILLTSGVIFTLIMYQLWQYDEITRFNEIEKHFAILYVAIRDTSSSREGTARRYTLLAFMIIVVVLGATVANTGINNNTRPRQ